jgi:hypothetical protein
MTVWLSVPQPGSKRMSFGCKDGFASFGNDR